MKLNIGCADVIIPGWINIDRNPGKGVTIIDVTKGLPYPDNSTELIFGSHFLEHLSLEDGLKFLKECYRVLVPGGYCRMTVPDMNKHIDIWHQWKSTNDPTPWIDYVTKDHYENIYHGGDNLFDILTQAADDKGDHLSLYTWEILWLRFKSAGFDFRNIFYSNFRSSFCKELRGPLFDNREKFTLFMEAVK